MAKAHEMMGENLKHDLVESWHQNQELRMGDGKSGVDVEASRMAAEYRFLLAVLQAFPNLKRSISQSA